MTNKEFIEVLMGTMNFPIGNTMRTGAFAL